VTPSSTTVNTPEFRANWAFVFEARKNTRDPDKRPRFELEALFAKGADLSKLKAAAEAAVKARWPEEKTRPKTLRSPFKNQSDKEQDGYVDGATYMKPWSYDRPAIVGPDAKTPVFEPSEFYSGCYAIASVTAFAYPRPGVTGQEPGVAFQLNCLQKTRDGESLSGRVRADQAFQPIEAAKEDAKDTGAASIFG